MRRKNSYDGVVQLHHRAFFCRINSSGGIQFNEHVAAACLPPANFLYSSRLNLTISGWGKVGYEGGENDGARPRGRGVVHLREGVVPIISRRSCSEDKVYGGGRLSHGMFCAGHLGGGGADACQGDSGGPAVADVGGRKTLLGITSWGYGCSRPWKPGVYTKVAKYVEWIREKTDRA